jgi:hypothetical protein
MFFLVGLQAACHHEYMMILRPETAQRKISIHVFLRLTRMDVCCGPPSSR